MGPSPRMLAQASAVVGLGCLSFFAAISMLSARSEIAASSQPPISQPTALNPGPGQPSMLPSSHPAALSRDAELPFGKAWPVVHGERRTYDYLWGGNNSGAPRALSAHRPARLAVAGLYNTGTNALYNSYILNCKPSKRSNDTGSLAWIVNPGKHSVPWLGRLSSVFVRQQSPGGPEGMRLLSLREALSLSATANVSRLVQSTDARLQQTRGRYRERWRRLLDGKFAGGSPRDTLQQHVALVIVRHPIPWLFKSMCRKPYNVRPLPKALLKAFDKGSLAAAAGLRASCGVGGLATGPVFSHYETYLKNFRGERWDPPVSEEEAACSPEGMPGGEKDSERKFLFEHFCRVDVVWRQARKASPPRLVASSSLTPPPPSPPPLPPSSSSPLPSVRPSARHAAAAAALRHALDAWTDFYAAHYERYMAGEPVLFVRMEDLVLSPYETTRTVCRVARDVEITRDAFRAYDSNAKRATPGHVAIEVNDTAVDRLWYRERLMGDGYVWSDQVGVALDDAWLEFVNRTVNHTLLQFFGYRAAPPPRSPQFRED